MAEVHLRVPLGVGRVWVESSIRNQWNQAQAEPGTRVVVDLQGRTETWLQAAVFEALDTPDEIQVHFASGDSPASAPPESTTRYPGWETWLGHWATDVASHRALARYRGGISGLEPASVANLWAIQIGTRGIAIGQAVYGGAISALANLPTRGIALHSAKTWSQVEGIRIESEGRERINKGAIASFGVFAVNAKVPMVSLTIATDDAELFFEADGSLQEWKAAASRVIKADRDLASKFRIPSSAPGVSARPSSESTLDELERLAKLHQDGLLTEQEFNAAKSKILGT